VIYIDLPPWVLYPFLFVLGSIVGSFLNVCVYRIPQHERLWDSLRSLWGRPSHCRRCQTHIRWSDNIPIFGWLILRGRCRTCRAWISPRYPVVELLTAVLFVVVFWCEIGWGTVLPLKGSSIFSPMGPQHAPGLDGMSASTFVLLRYAYHMVLICALIVASLIDIDLRIVPDGSTLPAMIVGVLGAVCIGRVHLVPVWFENASLFADSRTLLPIIPAWITSHPHLHGLAASLVGLIVGGGLIWGVRLLGHWTLKQEAMGFGDVILMATIGSFLGWQPTLIVFFLAPVCALVVVVIRAIAKRERVIPYVPYLSAAALLTLIFWPMLWPWAERIVGMGPLLFPAASAAAVGLTLCLIVARQIRQLLGIAEPAAETAVWTAADQNFFLAGEQVDEFQGRWRPSNLWPGKASGRGLGQVERWKGR
jgi:leader peptidase (prepilin peptidase) / N-methyltransferase